MTTPGHFGMIEEAVRLANLRCSKNYKVVIHEPGFARHRTVRISRIDDDSFIETRPLQKLPKTLAGILRDFQKVARQEHLRRHYKDTSFNEQQHLASLRGDDCFIIT